MEKKSRHAHGIQAIRLQKTFFLAVLLAFISAFSAFSQNSRMITGVVTDSNGEPIIGANVTVSGNKAIGTSTNVDGKFSLNVPERSTLDISFIGYESKKVTLGSESALKIALKDDSKILNDVIVVGYGTQTKASLTGAISSVNNKELAITKNMNTQNMLTGKIPGVRVIQKTSEPGEFTNQFDIRGFGSPLIVVDGVPRGNLERMDPNEIESISVLKDASAAIYGVRAANGVVLITTKKGDLGKPKLTYNMYYGIQNPAEILRPIGAVDRMTLFNEVSMRSTTNPQLTYKQEDFDKYADGTLTSTDWYDAVIDETAGQQDHNLNISGGTKDLSYFVNFGYTQQDGFWKSGDLNYQRYNLRSNVDGKITDNLKFALKLNCIKDDRVRPYASSWEIFKTLWRSVPTEQIYANNNPAYFAKPASDIQNAVAMINTDVSGFYKSQNRIFQSTAELSYEIPYIKGLTAKGLLSFDNSIGDNSTYTKKYNEYTYNATNDVYTASPKNDPTKLTRYYGNSQTVLYQISLNYKNTFAEKHNVSGLILLESSRTQSDNINASREFSISLPYLFVGNTLNQVGTANANGIADYASNGIVGRVNYDYEGKYLGEFSFRCDGSSRFPTSKQYGFFPGGSLGWRMSEESFIKDNLYFVDNLKLRASYGVMGDDGALDYQYLTGYDYPNTNGYYINNNPTGYVFNGAYTNALGFRVAANPNITWFTAKTFNVGMDADFLNGLFGYSIDVFKRDREGLLDSRNVSLPGTFGVDMPQENLNSDRTKGIEIELRHRNKIGDFSYNVTGNVAITRGMTLYNERTPSGNSYDNWRNNNNDRYNDIWFGLGANGRYTSYNQIANSDIFTGIATLPGDYIYEDWNGDGVIDGNDNHPVATTTNAAATAVQDKRNYPLMNFGLNMSMQYKGFDLAMLFQGSAMSYVAYGEQLTSPLSWNGNALSQFMSRWHPADATKDPYDRSNEWISGYYAFGGTTADSNSKFFIQNGAYVRLKTIELGYTLPRDLINRIGIKDLRIFTNGYNLLTVTGVKGVDPEHPSELYGYMYPLNKTVNIGANITF